MARRRGGSPRPSTDRDWPTPVRASPTGRQRGRGFPPMPIRTGADRRAGSEAASYRRPRARRRPPTPGHAHLPGERPGSRRARPPPPCRPAPSQSQPRRRHAGARTRPQAERRRATRRGRRADRPGPPGRMGIGSGRPIEGGEGGVPAPAGGPVQSGRTRRWWRLPAGEFSPEQPAVEFDLCSGRGRAQCQGVLEGEGSGLGERGQGAAIQCVQKRFRRCGFRLKRLYRPPEEHLVHVRGLDEGCARAQTFHEPARVRRPPYRGRPGTSRRDVPTPTPFSDSRRPPARGTAGRRPGSSRCTGRSGRSDRPA